MVKFIDAHDAVQEEPSLAVLGIEAILAIFIIVALVLWVTGRF